MHFDSRRGQGQNRSIFDPDVKLLAELWHISKDDLTTRDGSKSGPYSLMAFCCAWAGCQQGMLVEANIFVFNA